MTLDSKAQEILRHYKRETRTRELLNVLGISLIIGFALILGMMLAGDRFSPVLQYLGLKSLYVPEKGVYADCSDPRNRDVGYCGNKAAPVDKNWQNLRDTKGKAMPFNLSGL